MCHCHSVTSFLATSQLPSCPFSSLESYCGASRWRPWPSPTLQLPRQAFPFCHQVTTAAADWDLAYSPGKRYPDEGALSHPLPFLALYCWGLCFIESQPRHILYYTAWGSGDVPIEGPRRSLGESASGHTSWPSSCLCLREVIPVALLPELHSYGTFFQGPCLCVSCLPGM